MELLPIVCNYCKNIIYRSKGRINEAKKFGWNAYCSLECQGKVRNRQKTLKCSNLKCNKIFNRAQKDIKCEVSYCSLSCAASINNSKYPKRKAKVRNCKLCQKTFTGKARKYCSRRCKYKTQVIPKEIIIQKIRNFYKSNGRIPLKREFTHYNSARYSFKNWTNAVKVAGFNPNPIKFSNKFIAIDGHLCDSLAEKIIDDWLFEKNINHERNVFYPGSKTLKTDFVIKNHWVEFFGLAGEMNYYDEIIKKKRRLAKKYKLSLIEIYPSDLFPRNRLLKILRPKVLRI